MAGTPLRGRGTECPDSERPPETALRNRTRHATMRGRDALLGTAFPSDVFPRRSCTGRYAPSQGLRSRTNRSPERGGRERRHYCCNGLEFWRPSCHPECLGFRCNRGACSAQPVRRLSRPFSRRVSSPSGIHQVISTSTERARRGSVFSPCSTAPPPVQAAGPAGSRSGTRGCSPPRS